MEGAKTQKDHGPKSWSVEDLGLGTQERLLGGMQGCQPALLDLAPLLPLGTLLPFPGAPAQTWKEGRCIRWVRLQFWEETQQGHLAVVVTQKQQRRWHLGQLQGLLQVSWSLPI